MLRPFFSKLIFTKTALISAVVFFVFTGICAASLSSSESYKLHTAMANGGGAAGSSTAYNAENSVGSPMGTAVATGTSYKIYSGLLATTNALPGVTISSYNDGLLINDDTPSLEWTYEDKDTDPQRYYQVQVSQDNFVTLAVDSGLVTSSDTSFTTPVLSTDEAGVSYRWRVRVSDGFDYSGWQNATAGFRLTTAAMDVPIIWARVSAGGSEIPAKLWQDCGTPYMYWEYPVTGLDIAGYSYAWGSMPDDQIDTTDFSYQTDQDLLSDGVRVFNLTAQNTGGSWSDMASFEIWIDRGDPTVGQYSPTNGTTISTDVPTISISASDEYSGINPSAIDMTINKSSVNATYDEGAQSIVYIPSVPLSDGDNTISLEVSDFVGNTSTPLIWSFMVDTKGPTGSIIINNQDALTNSIYVNLMLSARDSTTDVQSMSISNDGVFDTETWEPFSTRRDNWTLPAISGTRKVYVKFKDTAGNESEILNDTIELIIIAPDTIITSGPNLLTKSTTALFTFKATIDNCVFRWKFDDEEWSEWNTKNSITREELSQGNHYFKVQSAKDVNNNSEIDADEIDPVPEERTWTISETGTVKPDLPTKNPFKFWKKE
ncbi:hypothetical protein ACFL2G_01100 [Candidatus Omnitrophota bacterium]